MKSNETLLALAERPRHILDDSGYIVGIVGGVLRSIALGGTTHDVGIAVLVAPTDFANLVHDINKQLPDFQVQHICNNEYAKNQGFLADWRSGDVNIVAYSLDAFATLPELISSFDLNINMYYMDSADNICNDHFDGHTVTYNQNPLHLPRPERVARFKVEYPHLDWSNVHV